jgi:hypothetical protein
MAQHPRSNTATRETANLAGGAERETLVRYASPRRWAEPKCCG